MLLHPFIVFTIFAICVALSVGLNNFKNWKQKLGVITLALGFIVGVCTLSAYTTEKRVDGISMVADDIIKVHYPKLERGEKIHIFFQNIAFGHETEIVYDVKPPAVPYVTWEENMFCAGNIKVHLRERN